MTHDHETSLPPAHSTATAALDLLAALRDDTPVDLRRPHLMFLLTTDYLCHFSYLRDAVNLTDRTRRHLRVLRFHGYAAISQEVTGAGWACLSSPGTARRDAQFAAFLRLSATARGHRAKTRASKPDWSTPGEVTMTDAATKLADDLDAVAVHLPLIAAELRTRTLTPARQHTIGALLIELGESLHQHADTRTPPKPRACLELPPANHSELP